MNTQMIKVEALPKTLHSHGVKTGNLIFTTGQLGRDPQTGELADDIGKQTRQALNNLKTLAESQGLTMDHVVRMTIYVANIEDVPHLNKVYFEEFFPVYRPARTCVEVSRIAKNALLELDAVITCKED